jgi:hypothetical protein
MRKTRKGRILFPQVTQSRRVGRLGARGALIYTWLLSGCDDQGRIPGDAAELKEELAPFVDDVTADDIEGALAQMERLELVIQYEERFEGVVLTQVVDWWRWQGRLRYKQPSDYQAPSPQGECWIDCVTGLVQGEDDYGRPKLKWVGPIRPGLVVFCPICEKPLNMVL